MIRKTDILLDILDRHPRTLEVVRDIEAEIGSCVCCEMLFASIEEIGQRYHLDPATLLQRLNASTSSY